MADKSLSNHIRMSCIRMDGDRLKMAIPVLGNSCAVGAKTMMFKTCHPFRKSMQVRKLVFVGSMPEENVQWFQPDCAWIPGAEASVLNV